MPRWTLPIVLAALACGAGPAPSDVPAPAPVQAPVAVAPPEAPPGLDPPPAGWLVWHGAGADAKTAWIGVDGQVRAVRDGVVLAGRDSLYRWHVGEAYVGYANCACEGCIQEPATIDVGQLLDFADGAAAATWDVVTAFDTENDADPRQTVTLAGTFDRYAIVHVREQHATCGVEGSTHASRQVVLDLVDAGEATLVPDDEAALLADEHLPAFVSAFPPPCAMRDRPHPRLVAVEPTWTREGDLQLAFRFAAALDPERCAFGDWESDFSDASVPAARVPAALAPWTRLPEPIRSYWSTLPEGPRGWTSVPAASEAVHWLVFGYGTADGSVPAGFLAWGEREGAVETTWIAFDGSPRASRPGRWGVERGQLVELATPSQQALLENEAATPAVLREYERTVREIDGWSAVPAVDAERLYALFETPPGSAP